MSLKSFFSKAKQPVGGVPTQQEVQASVSITDDGLMIALAFADGRFWTQAVSLRDALAKLDGRPMPAPKPWAVGTPIAIDYEQLADAGDLPQWRLKLILDAQEEVVVHEGPRADVEQIAGLLRSAWMQANAGVDTVVAAGPTPAAPAARGPSSVAASVASAGGHSGSWSPPSPATPVQAGAMGLAATMQKPWYLRLWAVGPLLVLAVLVISGGAYFAATKYLQPKGPGLDLSSLSVDDVAMLDSNPEAIRSVQSTMIEAMNQGREQGARQAAQIEETHIQALKEMGLNPGASMKNALGCLAK